MNLSLDPPGLLRRFTTSAAFSLAETTMAVAIAALGIVSIMGLMPQGLETSRKTGNMAAETRIMQEIVGDLETTDWSTIKTYVQTNSTRQYDDQGVRIPDTGGSGSLLSYVAQLSLSDAAVPGSSGGANAEPYMQNLTVKIASTTKASYSFPLADASRYKTISYLLTKTQ